MANQEIQGTTNDVDPASVDAVVMPFPTLRGTSLPSDRYGAWIVQRVTAGWVHLMSADLTATLRMPVDRFNWYWDEFDKARSA